MTVKEMIEELKKYPEDTKIYIENRSDDFWLTFIDEPWFSFKEEIRYEIEKDRWRMYYAWLKKDWVLNNVLIIK